MRSSLLVATTLLGSILAGCFADEQDVPDVPPAPFEFVDPMSSAAGHDHADVGQHQSSLNMTLVGHHPLVDQDADVAHSHSIDRCENWLVLGREREGESGVDIVDVSEPTMPAWVGRYRDDKAVAGDRDVAWSADCDYVFMGNQGSSMDSSGVLVINADNKAHPVFESRYQIPGVTPLVPPIQGCSASLSSGVHTVYALKVGGDQFVYALNWGVHILKATRGGDGKLALEFQGRYVTADAERLAETNENGPDCVGTRRSIYGHDMTVYQEGSNVIMYVAYAYDGLRIVDITDPTAPKAIGHWVPGGAGAPHYVHSVKSYMKGSQRITIVGSETFEDRNTDTASPLWILDSTDAESPQLLSTWSNPGGHGADHLLFSLHFYEVENELLWLTHYHGGVWVLDISDSRNPWVRGYYMPSQDTGYVPDADCCGGWKFAGVPMTFDIKVHDGIAYAADFSTGVYALRLSDAD